MLLCLFPLPVEKRELESKIILLNTLGLEFYFIYWSGSRQNNSKFLLCPALMSLYVYESNSGFFYAVLTDCFYNRERVSLFWSAK